MNFNHSFDVKWSIEIHASILFLACRSLCVPLKQLVVDGTRLPDGGFCVGQVSGGRGGVGRVGPGQGRKGARTIPISEVVFN